MEFRDNNGSIIEQLARQNALGIVAVLILIFIAFVCLAIYCFVKKRYKLWRVTVAVLSVLSIISLVVERTSYSGMQSNIIAVVIYIALCVVSLIGISKNTVRTSIAQIIVSVIALFAGPLLAIINIILNIRFLLDAKSENQ